MELMIMNPGQVTLVNKKLLQATTRIYKLGDKVRSNLYQIAQELVKIDEGKLYEQDGFASVTDYAQQVLGVKKTTAYNLVKIGRTYTAPELPGSNLPHDEDKDYTVAQLEKLLPITRDEALALIEQGIVTVEMSSREIAKAVKEYKKSLKADGEGQDEQEDEPAHVEVPEVDAEELDPRECAEQRLIEALAVMADHYIGKVALKKRVLAILDEVISK